MTRVLFGALAVADAVLLAYLFLLYGWFAFDFNDSSSSSAAISGDWAVAVDLAPRQGGRWNKGSEPTRDESLCESRTQPGYANDWFAGAADFRRDMAAKCGLTPERNRAACFAFAPDLPPFEESGDEQMMRAFCELARNGEGCHRYAVDGEAP